ncbi:helix-turn-helix domain-containing protein [Actinokineospora sp. 24-640]
MPLTPAEARRLLRYELEQMCAKAGVTHAEMGARLGVSRASFTQLLAGKNLPSRPALEIMAQHLDATRELPRLVELLAVARLRSAEREPGPGAHDHELAIGMEAFAERLMVFDPWRVPLHLRTEMYADALTALDGDLRNTSRERRQAPLSGDDPLDFLWVTTEHVLRRRVGSPLVMCDQLAYLAQIGGRPNISIRVIPADMDFVGAGNSFQIIWGTSPMVVEHGRLAVYFTYAREAVEYFTEVLGTLDRQALDARASVELISRLMSR